MNERVNKLDCEKVIQKTGAQGVTEMVDRWDGYLVGLGAGQITRFA